MGQRKDPVVQTHTHARTHTRTHLRRCIANSIAFTLHWLQHNVCELIPPPETVNEGPDKFGILSFVHHVAQTVTINVY